MSKLSQFLGGVGGGGGIGGMPTQIVIENALLEPNHSVGIDTSKGSVEVTLPPDPEPGDRLFFFDASLTWDIYPAVINTNNQIVEGGAVELTSYTLSGRGGVQEILFISNESGWKDISLYATSVNPHWFGSKLQGEYGVQPSEGLSCSLQQAFSTSGEFVVLESGYYCLSLAGGTGGLNISTERNATSGGASSIAEGILDPFVISSGTLLNHGQAGERPPLTAITLPDPVTPITYLGAFAQKFLVSEPSLLYKEYHEGELFGVPIFIIPGAYDRTGSTVYSTHSRQSCSIVKWLEQGTELVIQVGAAGTAYGTIYKSGNRGKVEVYKLSGLYI